MIILLITIITINSADLHLHVHITLQFRLSTLSIRGGHSAGSVFVRLYDTAHPDTSPRHHHPDHSPPRPLATLLSFPHFLPSFSFLLSLFFFPRRRTCERRDRLEKMFGKTRETKNWEKEPVLRPAPRSPRPHERTAIMFQQSTRARHRSRDAPKDI